MDLLKNKINQKLLGISLFVFVASLFFVLSVWLPHMTQGGHFIDSWPDAMANHAFITQFMDTGTFSFNVVDNSNVSNIIHPRSTNVFNNSIVPMSFLGMLLLFGVLGKIIGSYGVLFLTPVMAALVIPAYFGLMKRILSERGALFSTILLATLAPFLYYANMVMLHTLLFVSLVIFGFYFLTKPSTDAKWYVMKGVSFSYTTVWLVLGSFFLALALAVRTVELPWIALLLLILLLVYKQDRQWIQPVIIFSLVSVIVFLPILFQNNALYGSPFSTGYLDLEAKGSMFDQLPSEFAEAPDNVVLKTIKTVFLPFGFNRKSLIASGNIFWVKFFGPYLLFAVAGLILLFKKGLTKNQAVYLLSSGVAIGWLVFYYGNWQFEDLDILTYNTIGSSYMRYWLPAFIMVLPGIAYLLDTMQYLKYPHGVKKIFVVIVLVLLSLYSLNWAFLTPRDGLLDQKNVLDSYYERYDATAPYLEEDTLLLVDHTDKIFWPQYDVVIFLLDHDIFPELKKIVYKRPVKYITVMPDKDIDYINRSRIKNLGLQFTNPIAVDGTYRLFTLEPLTPLHE